jgi:hypothetical protein
MIKLIIPVFIIFLIILFWEKISEIIYKNFNIKLNHLFISFIFLAIIIILILLKN